MGKTAAKVTTTEILQIEIKTTVTIKKSVAEAEKKTACSCPTNCKR